MSLLPRCNSNVAFQNLNCFKQMLTFNTFAKDSLKVIKKSKIWRAFNMLMVGFAWQRVRNKTGIKVEKSWINYVKWPASKMGRLTKTWHLPRPQSNGIDLKGEPKIYISLNLFAKFYLITFYAGLPWNNTRMEICQSPSLRIKRFVVILNLPWCRLSKSGQQRGGWGE